MGQWVRRQKFHQLTMNYRSGADILGAAGAVIAANHHGEGPSTKAMSPNPGLIYRYFSPNAQGEAAFIAQQVQRLVGGTSHREIEQLQEVGDLALSDIAVLYRTSKQAESIALALAERTIPCQLVGLQPFYLSGEAKIIYYVVLLAAERIDQAELLFLLGREEGIGAQTLAAVEQLLVKKKSSHPLAELALAAESGLLPDRIHTCLGRIKALVAQLNQQESVAGGVDLVVQHYSLKQDTPEVIRFRQMAASAVSLTAFADHLRRHQDSVIYDDRAESVLLATLHAAKGLEFRAVFMAGCEEGLLPLVPRSEVTSEEEQEHIQEERRLFFVGMTRAAEELYLTGAGERRGFAGIEFCSPSRFLAEIPINFLQRPPHIQKKRQKKSVGKQLRLF
ncbi:MAG: ATP-dependent helicase [Candidatus Electrothrix sp. AR3]|nr:ATP-dependent helicase [Candidatus Electrothrix sp. AR3]